MLCYMPTSFAKNSQLPTRRRRGRLVELAMLSFWNRSNLPPSSTKEVGIEEIENLLKRLLGRLGHQPVPLSFNAEDMSLVNKKARAVLQSQPMLLEIEPPIKIVGDIHGQFYDLLRLFDFCGNPATTRYLFLGDYVDRGQFSLETLCLVLALKVKYPESFWILRGNHECRQVNRVYGFYDEMRRRFGNRRGSAIWRDFCLTFNFMPAVAVVGSKILCMHGGLSPDFENLDQIRQLQRPCEIPDYGLMCDLVWSDPDPEHGWGENPRGISFNFGNDLIKKACERFGVDLIVRGHQLVTEGYRFCAGGRMLTIFSSPNYCTQVNNDAGVLCVDRDLVCSFEILRVDEKLPLIYRTNRARKAKKTNRKQKPSSVELI